MKKALSLLAFTAFFASSAFATKYDGKCARAAEFAVQSYYANVPNASPEGDSGAITSKVTKNPQVYVVDGLVTGGNGPEDTARFLAQVTFADANKCTGAVVVVTK